MNHASAPYSFAMRPARLTSAATVWHLAPKPNLPDSTREITRAGRLRRDVYRKLITQLQASAMDAGMDLVYDVRIGSKPLESDVVEWSAVGMAVRSACRNALEVPIVTTLSASQCSLLCQSGLHPAGMVIGTCDYWQVKRQSVQKKLKIYNRFSVQAQVNGERKDYTDALTKARKASVQRMTTEAGRLGADGIMAVNLDINVAFHSEEGCLFTVTATGEAVVGAATVPTTASAVMPLGFYL